MDTEEKIGLQEPVLFYEINTLPYGVDIDQIHNIFREERLVIYDSLRCGFKGTDGRPYVISTNPEEAPYMVVDSKHMTGTEVRELVKTIGTLIDTKKNEIESKIMGYCCGGEGELMTKYAYFIKYIKKAVSGNDEIGKEFDETRHLHKFPALSVEQLRQLKQRFK